MMKKSLGLLASVVLFGCAGAKPDVTSQSIEIIDAHIHTNFREGASFEPGEERYTAEGMRAAFGAARVVGAVSHTRDAEQGYSDLRARNVVHCAGVRQKIDVQPIDDGLKARRFGCIKIYLGYVYRYAYDSAYEPIYKLAEKHDVPVVFHTGDTFDVDGLLKYADPLTIDEVAVKHRKVRFVIAHAGNPWIQSAAEVAYKNKNVYLDGSAMLIGDMRKLPPEKVDDYVVKPLRWIFGYVEDPTKLMFGSDWPLANIEAYVDAFKRAIPREHWQDVFHDNALRVFTRLKQ